METTTMERLQMATDSYGAVVRYGNLVIATSYSWHKGGVYGNDARIYRLTETSSENPWQGKSFIECGLELIKQADQIFPDDGHALSWALTAAMAAE